MAFTFISIAGVAIGVAVAVWAREDARLAQRQVARLREAIKPFADLVLDAADEDPAPAAGVVHCLVRGGGELGALECADFHRAAVAYATTGGDSATSRNLNLFAAMTGLAVLLWALIFVGFRLIGRHG